MSKLDQIRDILSKPAENYARAKDYSEEIDKILGLVPQLGGSSTATSSELSSRTSAASATQNVVHGNSNQAQNWSHLSPQIWQTPYHELLEIVAAIGTTSPGTWVDLGAGFGRLGIILGTYATDQRFIGYEIEHSRVAEGQRIYQDLGIHNAQLFAQDLSANDFTVPVADYYFMYDYGHTESILRTLDQLREISLKQKITVIGRGRDTRQLIALKHPWLGSVIEPLHTDHWSIYRSRE